MVDRIRVETKPTNLTMVPNADGSEVADPSHSTFEVIVTNDSREFASFQVELSTPGIESDAVVEWYRVEPEVCTKKPPGASTLFRVAVVRPPLPIFDETIDLFLHVFSVEFPRLRTTQKLRLTIGKPQQPLNLVLPNKKFRATPGDRVDIPLLLYNASPRKIEATLVYSNLPSDWLSSQESETVWVEPGHPTKMTLTCNLPPNPHLLKQLLPFTIEAHYVIQKQRFSRREQGELEILPLGTVEFHCPSADRQIPPRWKWKHLWKERQSPAAYDLELKNASNTEQRIIITTTKDDLEHLHLSLPEPVILQPGERIPLQLTSYLPRPWIGRKQRFRFDATAKVIEPVTGAESDRIRAVPSHHTLELQILPLIPPWLLIASGLVLLLLLWLYALLNLAPHHQAPVNSVRLDGNASNVFSGSSDQSIFRWQVNQDEWQIPNPRLKYEGNIGANLSRAVRVLRVNPTDNNLIAVGLENGAIELWNVSRNRQQKSLFKDNDRVFDLDFTKDSDYLFSGHGSSRVRQWNLATQKVVQTIATRFTISSLAVDKVEDSTWIAIAGQYNQIALWDWKQQRLYNVNYGLKFNTQSLPNQTFLPISGQHHYIESIALDRNLLITADNTGTIIVWDFQNRQCFPSVTRQKSLSPPKLQTKGNCTLPILDQWADGHDGKAVRAIALTQDEQRAYLASAGDDGRVKLWVLTQGKRLSQLQNGKVLASYPNTRLHAVDIKTSKIADQYYIFVASDAPNFHVKLYREPLSIYASQP